ncbi:LexA family protein [Gimesia aquarii]|uniref:LexA repressor n=1 Tax=Gimesia aquarii TaxID=2527964 RepID=A0A517W3P7_9PLAN|nr:LexA family transcriptional regulator [Gimesia aquarii]QDT99881.1 LexA repressor [Gimesia aquarii]
MKKIMPRQKQILSFVRIFIAKSGHGPTVREIGGAFRMKSTNGASGHLKAIEAKDRLKRLEFMLRGIEVVDNFQIQFCGEVR